MDEPKRTSKRVAIVGGTLWGNRGAEAMLVTTIGQIRRQHPNVKFDVFSYYPDKDASICQDVDIAFHNFRPLNLGLKIVPLALLAFAFSLLGIRLPARIVGREVAALRDAEVVCDIGGITFCDGREIFLLFNVLSIVPAMLFCVPVVKLSQAMGPFQGRINRFFANRVLDRCHAIFARGDVTAKYLQTLDLKRPCVDQASDVAFCYQSEFSLTLENQERIDQLASDHQDGLSVESQSIAVIPSSLVMQQNDAYVQQLQELVVALVTAGHKVLLLPNATREGVDKARNNDLVVIQRLMASMKHNHPNLLASVNAVNFDANTDGLRQLIDLADLVVTSRFHGMIAALAAAKPVVVIGWSHKYAEVLDQFGCEDLAIDHNAIEGKISDIVLKVLAKRDCYRQKIVARLPSVTEASVKQFARVSELLLESASPKDSAKQDPASTSIHVNHSPARPDGN